MTYYFKRAFWISTVLYVATFVVGVLAGFLSSQDMSSLETVSELFWYVGMAVSLVLTLLFTKWYFKNHAIVPSAKSGFLFGLTSVLVSFALDFIFLTLGNSQGANVDIWVYYGDIRFWVIVGIVLLTATVVGLREQRK